MPSNVAPTLTGLATAVTYLENTVNAAPQFLDVNVTFTDPDNNYTGGTLTVSGLLAEDTVSIFDQGTGSGQISFASGNVSYGGISIGTVTGGAGGTLTVTFNATASSTAIDALIQNLTYANSSDTPTASRTLSVIVTDAAGASDFGLPHFAVASGAANPFNGIDVGFDSFPTLADVDGDGDLDAVIGEYDGNLNFYLNTGSATAPVYVEQTGAANPFNGIDIGTMASPTFADVDGDGKLDVVVGEIFAGLKYLRNTGTATAPIYVEQIGMSDPFDGIIGGLTTKPALADVDGDGDLDVVLGGYNGTLRVKQNGGSATAPFYGDLSAEANPFGSIDVGYYSAPTLGDVDGDGDLDLLVAGNSGALYFQNTGSATVPTYVQQTGVANPFDGIVLSNYSAPTLADVDGDGDLDAIVGNRGGGLITLINNSSPKQIIVNVTAEAEPVVAQDDAFTTGEATAITAGNLFGDNGSGADTAGVSVTEVNNVALVSGAQITLASGALLTVNADGTFDYNPNGTFDDLGVAGSGASNTAATDTFTYTITGGDTATVTITIDGVDGDDILQGSKGSDKINAGVGDDTVNSYDSRDTLRGEAGFDTLNGGDDNDLLFGGDDGDTLNGDAGNDLVYGDNGDDTLNGGAGMDRLFGGADADTVNGGDFNDTLYGQGGDDVLNGDANNDTLYGGGNSDQLFGGSGIDTLYGDNGNDQLNGGTEGDRLFGGLGHDTLNGDAGRDRLDGGAGNDILDGSTDGNHDTFVFDVGYQLDHINNYEQGVDYMELNINLLGISLTGQDVIANYGTLNGAGTMLTLNFSNGDILEIQSTSALNMATIANDIIFGGVIS